MLRHTLMMLLAGAMLLSGAVALQAAEQRIVLRDYLNEEWRNELLTYPFSAPRGACHAESVTLTGPDGQPVPVQLSEVEYWPGTQSVRTAKLSFIADLDPLATDTYTVRYGDRPAADEQPATDLQVLRGRGRVQITTAQFGARLLVGEETYPEPVSADQVPGPVVAMRLADGTWFGGSKMYGPGKVASYSAELTDAGPVFARVAVRHIYENGNTLDVSLQVAAGDNTLRFETNVQQHQPEDGFRLVLSQSLPPLVLLVQDEWRRDRECFMDPPNPFHDRAEWCEIPLKDYVSPQGMSVAGPITPGQATNLSPWEDWFGTYTQTRIRLRLEDTTRELQIRSLDAGAWVEPRPIEAMFSSSLDPDPAKGLWVGWTGKMMPLIRDEDGEVFLQANAAQGARKWTVSECLSLPGVAGLYEHVNYQSESQFPPETRPTVSYRLNEVKDYVLDWPDEPGRHPRLFVSRPALETLWESRPADPAVLERLLQGLGRGRGLPAGAPPPVPGTQSQQNPGWDFDAALAAYLYSGGSAELGDDLGLVPRLWQALQYELWGLQFGCAGAPAPIMYDALLDSGLIPEAHRQLLRARMAYYAYRLNDPAVWSAERGYMSGNQGMTVVWEISRGLTACAIPEHPMAREWYAKAQRLMEYFLSNMVGPAGEWPEAMGGHGSYTINMLLSFALASTNSGLHDYMADPRVKRLFLWFAKMFTPRDPRLRSEGRRYFPGMGRDGIFYGGGTCGVIAQALRDRDPEYAAELQWAWLEQGADPALEHLRGFGTVCTDPNLPARLPDWTSEAFPHTGAVLRHGLGTPEEHQVILYSGDHFAAFYPGHTGSFPVVFAYGVPVAGSFAGTYAIQMDELLLCHVTLARGVGTLEERTALAGYHGCAQNTNMWSWPDDKEPRARFGEQGGLANVSSFSALPRQDYAAVDKALHYPRPTGGMGGWQTTLPEWPPMPGGGQPPVDWRRQVLFLKDDDPAAAANYLLIRDSVTGDQPTMWQMWTVSETLDLPENVREVAAVLADKPGYQVLPARELLGSRFTAIGQFGVDVEYYVALPTGTPRHTLHWGTDDFDGYNKMKEPEYQDLLHLQMPGDGAYFVAFYPRKRDWPAPTFSTLGDGLIIGVSGDWGTDYGFLSALPAEAAGDGVSFQGTAGSVQDRATGLVLSLGATGSVRYGNYGLSGEAASLRVGAERLVVERPAGQSRGTVTVVAAGQWELAQGTAGVSLRPTPAGLVLVLSEGIEQVVLTKR